MGLLREVEHAAEGVAHMGADAVGEVVHVGVDAVEDVGRMVQALHGFLTDAGLGGVVRELAQLAEQADRLRRQLASAEASAKWSGAAAEGFRQRAQQRQRQLAELVEALDSAHEAVAAAYAMAGVF